MLRLSVTVLAVLSLATLHANQAGAPSPADLDRIVTRVLEANSTYVQTFRNLAAEETKDIQQFDKSGRVNKQRRIVSDLLVYQPTRTAVRADHLVDWVGREQVDGHEVVVLDYRSKTPKPQQDFLAHFGATAVAVRGRLWADAATFQLQRDRFEVVALHPNMPEPLLSIRREATYGESRFGILTPQRVVAEWFDRTGGTKQTPILTRAALLTYTYGAFRRFEVATEETIAAPGSLKDP